MTTTGSGTGQGHGKRGRRDVGLMITAAIGALVVLGVVAALLWIGEDQPLPTVGPSMRPTIEDIASLDVDYDAYDGDEGASPAIGDIVVAQPPKGYARERCPGSPPGSPCAVPGEGYSTDRLVKRIVAGPGDRISFAGNGIIVRNGRKADEPYVARCKARVCLLPRPITVPEGHYYLAGDNRPVSVDSRYFGPIPEASIDGRVQLPAGGAG